MLFWKRNHPTFYYLLGIIVKSAICLPRSKLPLKKSWAFLTFIFWKQKHVWHVCTYFQQIVPRKKLSFVSTKCKVPVEMCRICIRYLGRYAVYVVCSYLDLRPIILISVKVSSHFILWQDILTRRQRPSEIQFYEIGTLWNT